MRDAILRFMQQQMFEASDAKGGSGSGEESQKDGNSTGNKEGDSKDSKDSSFKAITSQEDLDDILTRRLSRQEKKIRDELRDEIAEELENDRKTKEAQEQGDFKTQLDAANGKIEKLEKKLREYEEAEEKAAREEQRREIARKHKITDDDLIALITGDDEDAMKASAKALAKALRIDDSPPKGDQGRTNTDKSKQSGADYSAPSRWGINREPIQR